MSIREEGQAHRDASVLHAARRHNYFGWFTGSVLLDFGTYANQRVPSALEVKKKKREVRPREDHIKGRRGG